MLKTYYFIGILSVFVALQTVEGESRDSQIVSKRKESKNQINTDQKKDTSENKILDSSRSLAYPHKDSECTQKAAQPTDNKKSDSDWTPFLVVCNFMLAGIAFYQAWLFRINGQKQLRAYISIAPQFEDDFQYGQIAPGRLVIINHGQTPAYDGVGWVMSKIADPEETVFDMNPKKEIIKQVHAIHTFRESLLSSFTIDGMEISEEQTTLFYQKKLNIYYWGEFRYYDTFRKRHRTAFRFAVGFDEQSGKFGSATVCQEGNEAN